MFGAIEYQHRQQGLPSLRTFLGGFGTISSNCQPPAKRNQANYGEGSSHNTAPAREYVYISDSSRSATPETEIKTETPEWMRARIAQLEAELDSARTSRDAAISEQDIISRAHQAEQNTCREAMEQKDAMLLREKAEQTRLRCKLAAMSARKSTPSNGNDVLWKQLADVKEALEQKLQPNGTALDDVKASIKTLESRLNRLESRWL
ncbi:unnamed protein product [Rhizoctonia solani]|uniref:Uncharacterized protein n=1 Tax=Rhizoctonia solani TaxID=456999 RepID=A0A8H3E5I1_9AGAM|nr:unnamed protein product [Rhizoctonia solani]